MTDPRLFERTRGRVAMLRTTDLGQLPLAGVAAWQVVDGTTEVVDENNPRCAVFAMVDCFRC